MEIEEPEAKRQMARVSITDLDGLRERTERKPSPDDTFAFTCDRLTRDYLMTELSDRRQRLLQALSAPAIKEAKRTKCERLLHGVSRTLVQLEEPTSMH